MLVSIIWQIKIFSIVRSGLEPLNNSYPLSRPWTMGSLCRVSNELIQRWIEVKATQTSLHLFIHPIQAYTKRWLEPLPGIGGQGNLGPSPCSLQASTRDNLCINTWTTLFNDSEANVKPLKNTRLNDYLVELGSGITSKAHFGDQERICHFVNGWFFSYFLVCRCWAYMC